MPDYACLIVGANMGIVGMCKEHMGVALALKVPVFFVITKVRGSCCRMGFSSTCSPIYMLIEISLLSLMQQVDIAPEHILKQTVQV